MAAMNEITDHGGKRRRYDEAERPKRRAGQRVETFRAAGTQCRKAGRHKRAPFRHNANCPYPLAYDSISVRRWEEAWGREVISDGRRPKGGSWMVDSQRIQSG